MASWYRFYYGLCGYFICSYSHLVSEFLSTKVSLETYKPMVIDFGGPGLNSSPGKLYPLGCALFTVFSCFVLCAGCLVISALRDFTKLFPV
jgi:hypothetical protein